MLSGKRLLSVLLALAMIAALPALCLTGCNNTGSSSETTEAPATDDVTTEAAVDPNAPRELFDLIVEGTSSINIVRPDEADTSSASVQAAMDIRNTLVKYSTVKKPDIGTDWTRDGSHEATKDDIEILVGPTNYAESQQAVKELNYGDYVIKAVGNKIVVLGHTDESMSYAATLFIRAINNCVTEDANTDKKTYTLALKPADFEKSGTKDKDISTLPIFENGEFSACYDAGDSCSEVIIGKTTPEAYKAYLGKLEGAGYKCYTGRDVTDNSFATYYNDNYTVNVGYYNYEKSVRIIQQPYAPETLIGLKEDNKFTPVTTSQITMLGLEYKQSDGGYASNGLSILIRLTDGRFIVVDGGFNRAADVNMITNNIKEQAPDPKNLVIAAWIITHSHGDHQGMIGKQYSTIKSNNIKVERFIINFMSDSERNKSINSSSVGGNWSSGEGGGWSQVYTAAAYLGSDIVVAHVGQVFYLADLEMEVLYTIESYGPKVTNALNTTSLIMKMTFTDPKTQKQTVYMSTGDATGPGFLIAYKMFGSYLKSDIVQVAHHGYTTWGTENGTTSAYIAMSPATLLWPQGVKAYPNYVNKSYNSVLWNTGTNPNYKETYVAGWEGSKTIVPLPYTVGSAIVTSTEPQ